MSLNARLKNVVAGKPANLSRRKSKSLLGKAVRATIDSLEGRRLLANPVANPGGPYTVNEGASININGGGSTDDGTIAAYAWDLNYKVSKGFRRGVTGQAFGFEGGDSGTPRTIALKVTDNDGNFTIATTTVTVDDVAPTVTLVGKSATEEGQPYALAWSSTDPGTDTITGYSIDWGDGVTTTHAAGVGNTTHTYAEDGNHTISFTAIDEDGEHVTAKDVTVTNVAPIIVAGLTRSLINEGEQTRVNFSSPNRQSSIDQWIIDWGDNSVSVRPGSKSFVTHTYADNGNYTVTVTALENDGTATDKTLSMTVKNTAPTLMIAGVPSTSAEGTAITAAASVVDLGVNDTFTYAWELKKGSSVVATSSSAGQYTFTPADNGSYTLKLVVIDNGGLQSTQSKAFTVTNVAPTGTITGDVPSEFYEGTTVQFTAAAIDAGSGDTHTYNWRVEKNGVAWTLPQGTNVSGTTFDFKPTDEGTYIVGCLITDDEGAAYIASTSALVVLNANPTATVTGGEDADEGDEQSFSVDADDAGVSDKLSYAWTVTHDNYTYEMPDNTSTNKDTFAFTPEDNGVYVVTVTVTDGDGGTVSESASSFTVANVDPTAELSVPTTGLAEGNTLSFSVDAEDAGVLDTLTYAWSVLKNGEAYEVVTPTNMATFGFAPDNEGSYVVSVTVTDNDGGTITKTSSPILVANAAPTANISEAPADIFEGDFLTFTSALNEPGAGDVVSYLWSVEKDGELYELPPGTTVDEASLDLIPVDEGDYVVTLKVTDDAGGHSSVTRSFTAMNIAPIGTIIGVPEESIDEGSTLNLAVTVSDVGYDDTFTYQWKVTLDGEEVELPEGVASTLETFEYVTRDNGTYVISCAVSDGDGGTHIAGSGNILVANVAPSGTIGGLTPRYATESATLPTNAIGTVGDGFVGADDAGGLVGEHATQGQRFAIFKWQLPAGLTTNDVLGATLTLARTGTFGEPDAIDLYAFSSEFNTLDASDYGTIAAGGGTLVSHNIFSATGTAVIDGDALTDAIKAAITAGKEYVSFAARNASLQNAGMLALTGIEGASGSSLVVKTSLLPPGGDEGTVQNFTATPTDAGAADTFTYAWSITKDDSPFTLPQQTVTTGRTFAFTPTDNGSYVVTVEITDDNGGQTTASTANITVDNVAPTVSIPNPANGTEGSPVVFVANASDAGSDDSLTYSWSVSKGGIPGTPITLPDDVVTTGSTFEFTPTDEGTYYATVVVTDEDGASATIANAVVITNEEPEVTITGAPTASVPEGTTVNLGTEVFDAGVDDGKEYLWTVSNDGVTPSLADITVDESTFSYTVSRNGTFVITVRVRDGDGGTTYQNAIITVTNAAPTAQIVDAPAEPVAQGSSASFDVDAEDPSPTDVLSYAWHVTRGGVPYVLSNNVATTNSTFTFEPTLAGSYVVTVTVTDNDGGTVDAASDLAVTNVAPIIESLGEANNTSGDVAKHTALSYSAVVADPGSETLTYTWTLYRDGEVFLIEEGETYNFSPTLSGEYHVGLIVSDGIGFDSDEGASFVVSNSTPSINAMTRSPIEITEGDELGYQAEVGDADGDDITYSWALRQGDELISTTDTPGVLFAPLQDGSYALTLTISDGEETSFETQEFTVTNLDPTASIGDSTSPPKEGVPLTLVGLGSDVVADTLTYAWSILHGETAIEGTGASFGFTPTDDGNYIATLTVSDGTATTTATKEFNVANNVPTGKILAPTLSGVTGWDSKFSVEDVSRYIGDAVTVDWDWGNGETTLGASVEAIQTRRWNTVGTYAVKATFKDEDGGSTVVTKAFAVNNYGVQPDPMGGEGTALVVNGTSGDDTITFERMGTGKIKAVRNGVSLGQTFNPTRIIANGDGGANSIVANANVAVPVIFQGGSGKDTLTGGGANDVILGRKGIDVLNGGAGRDFLIGGNDSDFLNGAAGEDILVGGNYANESYGTLAAIMNEWGNNSRTFTQRNARMRNGAEGLEAVFASGKVIGDSRADQITGGTESDWMFKETFSAVDTIVDATSADRVDNLAA